MAKLKNQTKVLKEVDPVAVGFLAPSSRQHTDILVYCTATSQVATSHWAAVAVPCLLFSTPVGPWHIFLIGVLGLRNQVSPRLPKQGFPGRHMGCLGHEEGGREAERGGLKEGSRSEKVVGFFSLINQITPAHSCCSWLAGLKNNSESPMLLMTSASCVGFWEFIFCFLGRRKKVT